MLQAIKLQHYDQDLDTEQVLDKTFADLSLQLVETKRRVAARQNIEHLQTLSVSTRRYKTQRQHCH